MHKNTENFMRNKYKLGLMYFIVSACFKQLNSKRNRFNMPCFIL